MKKLLAIIVLGLLWSNVKYRASTKFFKCNCNDRENYELDW